MPKASPVIQNALNDIKDFPMPTYTDIKKAEIAAFTCKTDKEFASFFDMDVVGFRIWYSKSKAFKTAVDTWKNNTTKQVEIALAKKATGFTKKTTKQILTKQGQVVDLVNEEYYPPDTAAAQFWLKNRNKEEWKDAAQIDVNVNQNIRAWLVNAMGADPSEALVGNESASMLIEGEAKVIENDLTINKTTIKNEPKTNLDLNFNNEPLKVDEALIVNDRFNFNTNSEGESPGIVSPLGGIGRGWG